MRVVIMQPTYLPWLGYFDLMDQADCFVVLDNVQFEQQSWQQRNRIKTSQGPMWLTVPIIRQFPQTIERVRINNQTDWTSKHWRTIEQNYRRAPFWELYSGGLKTIFHQHWEFLENLNLTIMNWVREKLGISTLFRRARDLLVVGHRTALLVNICKHLGADAYLSPLGSAVYLREDATFEAHGIRVEFQHFVHPVYRQLYPPFVPYLSAIDLLMNEGEASLGIIRSGRRPPDDLETTSLGFHTRTI